MMSFTLRFMLCCALAMLTAASIAPAADAPPSFRHEVVPLLTRFGCNQGACHGKLAGQNGFRLSLRGYAPEQDHDWITREFMGRRINLASPADSPLLRKPTMQAAHNGGQLFAVGSKPYNLLHDWIKAGAPGLVKDEPTVTKLEVGPVAAHTMKPGDAAQLSVKAHFSDGQSRDVTWLTQFFSNDLSVTTVTAEGKIEAKRAGATAIRIHFQDQVEVALVTIPREQPVDDKLFPPVVSAIDEHVFAKLKALRIPPAPLCDDATFLRRAYLDAIGTLPTPDEARAFLADNRPDKRARLVDELLKRPEWTDYWTLQLADLFQNRKERDHDVRGPKGVRAFHAWMRGQLAAERTWDKIARDVLLADGDTTSNPAVGYFVVTVGEKRPSDRSEIVASAAQSFLGTRIGCAQCHNHPSEKYTQDDYYHFAAFFSRVSLDREEPIKGPTKLLLASEHERNLLRRVADIEKKIGELESQTNAESGKADEAKKKIEEQRKQLEGAKKELDQSRMKPVQVQQPRTNQMLPPQPLDRATMAIAAGQDPRGALADWMVKPDNPWFAGAMVNRLWKHYMRVGLVEPVDDLRSSNPPSNPALWAALKHEFVAHGYDLKHIMRLIMTSHAYQLSSATQPGNELDDRFYSHFYTKRLPAEVLLDAVSQATDVPDQFAGYPTGLRAIQLPDPGASSYFLSLFGRSDRVTACACERNGEVTLPQLLHMLNGDIVQKIKNGDGRLAALLRDKVDDAAAIDTLFLATLSRLPREEERKAVQAAIGAADNREEALQDLFWALLNSKEFAFNH